MLNSGQQSPRPEPCFEVCVRGADLGRQREYNLYFTGGKQANTRSVRVEKYAQNILDGKGFRDR